MIYKKLSTDKSAAMKNSKVLMGIGYFLGLYHAEQGIWNHLFKKKPVKKPKSPENIQNSTHPGNLNDVIDKALKNCKVIP